MGLDGGRLGRLTTYLDGRVSAGRIPGWLAVVSRAGKVAYLGTGGHRHVEDGTAGRARHDLPHLLDDQADHVAWRR